MVQNSQSLYSFTFNALIDIHEYIYPHSTTEFTFKKYIYSHLPVYFLFMIIFAHIHDRNIHSTFSAHQQMGILFAHARDETNILCSARSAPFVIFERAAAGFLNGRSTLYERSCQER